MRTGSAARIGIAVLLLGSMLTLWPIGQNDKQGAVELQAAKNTELVKGDLNAAIEQYRKILARTDISRAVAAKALFELGRCYERLGNEEARKAYEKLVAGFADQKGLSAQARNRLADLLQLRYPPTITLRRVWAGLEAESPGAPSQDGRYYTFGWKDTDDIAIRDLLTGNVRRLTREASWDDPVQFGNGTVISRDNRQIAYGWFAPPEEVPELRLMRLDGSKRRTLVRAGQDIVEIAPCAWTSDGKQVLTHFIKKDLSQQIGFVSAADGSIRILKSLPPRTRANSVSRAIRAKLSPDDRHVVFDFLSNEDCKEHDISLMSADGSREISLVQHPADDKGPVWTPDGKHVVFASDRTGSWGFWALSVVDGKPQGLPQLIKADIGQLRGITGITRQGACYYTTEVGSEDVYIASVDEKTGNWAGGAQPVAGRLMGSSAAPAWSPNGEYLAYLIQRPGYDLHRPGAVDIIIQTIRTGEERKLSTGLSQMIAPVQWFPDGRSILVGASENVFQNGDVAYYRIDLQSGTATLVTRAGWAASFPRLAVDGKTILYIGPRSEGTRDLALVAYHIDAGQTREIYRFTSYPRAGMAISPDGRQVAFAESVDDSQQATIKVLAISGGDPREPLKIGPPEYFSRDGRIAWMPDGQSLLVVRVSTKDSQMTQLWRVPIQGGEPQRLGAAMERIRFPSVHPDGRRIAFDSGIWKPRQLELWVMESFLPMLKP